MKDNELQFDRSCHVLYSKPCKKEILAKIALHYPAVEREAVWEQSCSGGLSALRIFAQREEAFLWL